MQNNFEKLVEKTLEMLSIDSVQAPACESSPFGKGVGDCLALVCETAKQMGMSVHNEGGYYCTCDVGEGETFGILGHVDTVPYDNDWSANPLGEIKDGYIYGRGVMDDKGPMLCCLYAVDALLKEGYKPKNKIRFIFGGNEESGWKCIEHYNEVDTMPEKGFSPDGDFPVINCEKGLVGYDVTIDMPKKLLSVEGGTRGNIVMAKCSAVIDMILDTDCDDDKLSIEVNGDKTYITAYGTPAHASTPEKGDNAFWRLMNFLAAKVGGEFKDIRDKFCHNDGSGAGIKLSDKKSGALTFNVGVVSGENLPSTRLYNRKMHLTIDIRHPVTYTKEQIQQMLCENLGAQVSIHNYHDPLYIDKDNPLVKKLLASYNAVTGENASPITIGGGTYARALKCGVAFGPIFPGGESTIHQKDERVSLEDFKKLYNVYYTAIKDLLFE